VCSSDLANKRASNYPRTYPRTYPRMSVTTTTRKKPAVAPTLNTLFNISDYVTMKHQEEIVRQAKNIRELQEESVTTHATPKGGSYKVGKYASELSKEHHQRKNDYFDFQIKLAEEEWDLLDKLILEPKVKGQILLAKKQIKLLSEDISKNRFRKSMWGVPY
jgi:hypothetical protein